jgi:hypothetical protein
LTLFQIYGTGNKLVIYNGLEFVQTIDASEFLEKDSNEVNNEKIFSVELSEFDGKVNYYLQSN